MPHSSRNSDTQIVVAEIKSINGLFNFYSYWLRKTDRETAKIHSIKKYTFSPGSSTFLILFCKIAEGHFFMKY